MYASISKKIYLWFVGLFRRAGAGMSSRDCIYVVAPTSAGSPGDQALFQGLTDKLGEYFGDAELVEVLIKRRHQPQVLRHGSLPTFNLNSGSAFRLLLLRRRLKSAKAVIIVGADTLDGSYALKKNLVWFKLAELSASLGIPTSIISFSFSNKPAAEAVERLKKLNPAIHFCSRDPISEERFEAYTGQACTLSADLAFLMQPGEKQDRAVSDWVKKQRSAGSLIVGLNVNPLGLQHRKEVMVQSYSQALTQFLDSYATSSILMIPHDFREGQSDQKIMAEIKDAIPARLWERILLVEGPFNAWDAKNIVSAVDFLITGRMHLAIAAMGQGIPAFGLAYKDKFEGLMQHFSITENLLAQEEALAPEALSAFIDHAVDQHASLRAEISRRLPEVTKKSLANLDNLIAIDRRA